MKSLNNIFLMLFIFVSVACTENKTIQNNPPVTSQAGGQTRTSDPDGWGGGSTGDGGGGQGVLCSDEAKDAKLRGRLIVRDVYEAQTNYRREMKFESLGPKGTEKVDSESIQFLLKSLKQAYGPHFLRSEFSTEKFWTEFAENIAYVPDDSTLYASNDANSPLALPKGCKIVQIAYWDESGGLRDQGTLYLNKNYWMSLDQFNKVALLTHEYFFKLARKAGFKNSDYTRYRVGQLLSSEGYNLFQTWVPSKDPKYKDLLPDVSKGFKYCNGYVENDRMVFNLYQYQNADGEQWVTILPIEVGNYRMPPFESVNRKVPTPIFKQAFFDTLSSEEDKIIPKDHPSRRRESADQFIGAGGQDTLFMYQFPLKDRYGAVDFMNPHSDRLKQDDKLLPQADLLILIKQTVERSLSTYFYSGNADAVSDADSIAALNVLTEEVNEAIQTRKYPTGFPKWTAFMKEMEKKTGKNPGSGFEDRPEVAQRFNKNLYEKIPRIFYRITIGSYDSQEVYDVLGGSAYQEVKSSDYYPIKIRVGSDSFNVTLLCNSYAETRENIDSGEPLK
jgi:hypothetical protein